MQHAMENAELSPVKFELGKDKSFKVIFYRPLLTSAKTGVSIDKENAIDLQRRIETLLRENAVVDYIQLFGVDTLIEEMKNLLMNTKGNWIISLFGEGGIGKTALAYEIVSRYFAEAGFTKVAWISAKTVQILPNGTLKRSSSAELRWTHLIKKIADQLGVQMGYSSTMWLTDFQKGIRSLPANDKCLIVVDNLETIEDLTETIYYLCGNIPSNQIINPHKIIITTRYSILGKAQHITEIQLRGIERIYALKFIRELGNENIKQASDEELMPIVSVTEGNPLLIKLSITRLLTSHLPLAIVLKELQEVNKQIGKNIIDYLHAESLLTLEQKCGGDAAHKILSAFCPLGTGGTVDYFDLFKYSGIGNEAIFRETLQTACDLSLIRVRPLHSRYSIHSLLWNFVCGIDG